MDLNRLRDIVLHQLAISEGRLTGNQVRFIRHTFGMTASQFADRFAVTHPAVLKWEHKADDVSRMDWATEKDICLQILRTLTGVNAAKFVQAYESLNEAKRSVKKIRWQGTVKGLGRVLRAPRRAA